MTMLIAAAAAFLGLHLLVSGTPMRGVLVAAVGEVAYMAAFSAASLALLVWLGFAFAAARAEPGDLVFWTINPALRRTAIFLALIGFLFMVPGLLTSSPTRVRGGALLEGAYAPSGMVRFTRHPFLWGIVIWSAAHLLANGRLADLILFGSLLLLGVLGPPSIDAKRMRALGERYEAFKAQTSNIPFAALLQGRQPFRPGEVGWRLLAGLIVFALILWLHPHLFGVDPLGARL